MTPDNFILLAGPGFDSLGHFLWIALISYRVLIASATADKDGRLGYSVVS